MFKTRKFTKSIMLNMLISLEEYGIRNAGMIKELETEPVASG